MMRWIKVLLTVVLLLPGTAGAVDLEPLEPAELAALLETPRPPLLLDIRGAKTYRAGSLPGALDAGRDPEGFLPQAAKSEVVLLPAADTPDERLQAWAQRLGAKERRLYYLAGGVAAWQEAGHEVERHDQSYTRPGTVPFTIPRGLCEMNTPAKVYD